MYATIPLHQNNLKSNVIKYLIVDSYPLKIEEKRSLHELALQMLFGAPWMNLRAAIHMEAGPICSVKGLKSSLVIG